MLKDDDGEWPPAAVERLRRTITAADAVLIATPVLAFGPRGRAYRRYGSGER